MGKGSDSCSLGWLLSNVVPLRSDRYPVILTLRTGYRFDILSHTAEVDFSYEVNSGESMIMELGLSGMPQPGSPMLGVVPSLDQLIFSYVPAEGSLGQQLDDCAKQGGLSAAMYVDKLLAQPDGRLVKELGFVPETVCARRCGVPAGTGRDQGRDRTDQRCDAGGIGPVPAAAVDRDARS